MKYLQDWSPKRYTLRSEAEILRDNWEEAIVPLIRLICRDGCRFASTEGVAALDAIMQFAKSDIGKAAARSVIASGENGEGI